MNVYFNHFLKEAHKWMLDAFENLNTENDNWSYKPITRRIQTTWKDMLHKLYEVLKIKNTCDWDKDVCKTN